MYIIANNEENEPHLSTFEKLHFETNQTNDDATIFILYTTCRLAAIHQSAKKVQGLTSIQIGAKQPCQGINYYYTNSIIQRIIGTQVLSSDRQNSSMILPTTRQIRAQHVP